MIDTINGAHSSAIIYSIAETAKANNLKPYDYFVYLLEEIPKHMDDTDRSFLDDLLPWSPNLPDGIRKTDNQGCRKAAFNFSRYSLLSVYVLMYKLFTDYELVYLI